MAKSVFTSTSPAGTTAKRTSEHCHYSHAVWAQRSYAHGLDVAQGVAERCDLSNFAHYAALVDGSSRFREDWEKDWEKDWESAEQHEARVTREVAAAVAALAGATTADEYAAAQRAARIAEVEADKAAGLYEEWACVCWCGRRDLADKQAAKHRGGHWINGTVAEAVKAGA